MTVVSLGDSGPAPAWGQHLPGCTCEQEGLLLAASGAGQAGHVSTIGHLGHGVRRPEAEGPPLHSAQRHLSCRETIWPRQL